MHLISQIFLRITTDCLRIWEKRLIALIKQKIRNVVSQLIIMEAMELISLVVTITMGYS